MVLMAVAGVLPLQAGLAPVSKDGVKDAAPIEISADGENRYQGGIAYAEGNVVVRHGEDTIYADQVSFDKDRRELTAKGNVRIFSNNKIYRGEFFTYNIDTKQIQSQEFRNSMDRIYAFGKQIESPTPNVYIIKNGGITTENRENPGYKVKAQTVEYYPDDRIIFKNVGIYVGDVPVMWLPYAAVPLKWDNFFDFTVGSSSRLGVYAIGSYSTALNKSWKTTLHVGEYTRRGVGGGVDLSYDPRSGDHGEFKSFYIHDDDPGIGAGPPDRLTIPNNKRYRYSYLAKYQLSPEISTTADLNLWSDKTVTEDFFPSEYQKRIQPDNFADLVYYDPNFTATLLARAQFGNLFNVTERKPELSFDFKRQQFFNTPLSYEGESSVVNFSRKFDRDLGSAAVGYDAVRYDTFHEFSYPRQYFDWLSLTPKAGVRATEYTHNNDPLNQDPMNSTGRFVYNAGLDASFKVSKTWSDLQNPGLGIDGLRHVMEPYAEAAYTGYQGSSPNDIMGFDSRIPSTRLAPLDYSFFNSIDSIDRQESVKQGFRNKLQTRRDGKNYDLVDWNLYTQANFSHSVNEGILNDSTYSEIYNEVNFYPVPWLTLDFYSATGIVSSGFDEMATSLTWQLHPAVDLTVSYNHLNHVNYPTLQIDNSDYVTFGTFWRLNENWRVSQSLGFEGTTGKFQDQSYTIYRDLSAWSVALTTTMRSNQQQQLGDEFLVYMSLTLKAFPEASLKANY